MLWCSFTAWAPHSILTKAKANAHNGGERRVQKGRCTSCLHACLKLEVWGTVLSPTRQYSAPRTQPFVYFPHFHFEPKYETLFSAPSTLQVRDVVLTPVPALPFLDQFAEAGGYCWDPAPMCPPATQENGCATSETSSMSPALEPSQASRPASGTKIYAVSSLSMWAY